MSLGIRNLSCGYTRKAVLTNANLELGAGQFVCLLGPNGSGKSALLKTLVGILKPLDGNITLEGRDWDSWTTRERAGLVAYVPQAHAPLFPFRVLDLVAMGRTARWPLWAGPSKSDWEAAARALERIGLSAFSERLYTQLSGGERQMVLVARVLAQEPRYLVLDEPASSLDFGNQVRVLQTLRRLVKEGLGVLMATHHPEHALRCASQVSIAQNGSLCPAAAPEQALNAARLESIYQVPFIVGQLSDLNQNTFTLCAPHID